MSRAKGTLTPTQGASIARDLRNGKTFRQIALEVGVSVFAVWEFAQQNGLKSVRARRSAEEIRRLIAGLAHLRVAEIAARLHIHRRTADLWIRRAGYTSRFSRPVVCRACRMPTLYRPCQVCAARPSAS